MSLLFPNLFLHSRALTLSEGKLHTFLPVRILQALSCVLKETPIESFLFIDFPGRRGRFFVRDQKTQGQYTA